MVYFFAVVLQCGCVFPRMLLFVLFILWVFFLLFKDATTTERKKKICFMPIVCIVSKHQSCFLPFRCCECRTSLSHWYYEKDGHLFCKKDYWVKFGELCHGCNDPITTGLIMVMTLFLFTLHSLSFINSLLQGGLLLAINSSHNTDWFLHPGRLLPNSV